MTVCFSFSDFGDLDDIEPMADLGGSLLGAESLASPSGGQGIPIPAHSHSSSHRGGTNGADKIGEACEYHVCSACLL